MADAAAAGTSANSHTQQRVIAAGFRPPAVACGVEPQQVPQQLEGSPSASPQASPRGSPRFGSFSSKVAAASSTTAASASSSWNYASQTISSSIKQQRSVAELSGMIAALTEQLDTLQASASSSSAFASTPTASRSGSRRGSRAATPSLQHQLQHQHQQQQQFQQQQQQQQQHSMGVVSADVGIQAPSEEEAEEQLMAIAALSQAQGNSAAAGSGWLTPAPGGRSASSSFSLSGDVSSVGSCSLLSRWELLAALAQLRAANSHLSTGNQLLQGQNADYLDQVHNLTGSIRALQALLDARNNIHHQHNSSSSSSTNNVSGSVTPCGEPRTPVRGGGGVGGGSGRAARGSTTSSSIDWASSSSSSGGGALSSSPPTPGGGTGRASAAAMAAAELAVSHSHLAEVSSLQQALSLSESRSAASLAALSRQVSEARALLDQCRAEAAFALEGAEYERANMEQQMLQEREERERIEMNMVEMHREMEELRNKLAEVSSASTPAAAAETTTTTSAALQSSDAPAAASAMAADSSSSSSASAAPSDPGLVALQQRQLAEAQSALQALTLERDSLSSAHSRCAGEISSLSESLARKSEALVANSEQVTSLQQSFSQLVSENARGEAQIHRLIANYEMQDQHVIAVKAERRALQDQVGALQSEVESLRALIAQAALEAEARAAELEQANVALVAQQADLSTAQAQSATARGELALLGSEAGMLRSQSLQNQEMLESQRTELADLRNKEAAGQTAMELLREQLRQRVVELAEQRAEIAALKQSRESSSSPKQQENNNISDKESVEALQSQLREASEVRQQQGVHIEQLPAELAAAQTECAALQEQNSSTTAAASISASHASEQAVELQFRLSAAESETSVLQARIQELESALASQQQNLQFALSELAASSQQQQQQQSQTSAEQGSNNAVLGGEAGAELLFLRSEVVRLEAELSRARADALAASDLAEEESESAAARSMQLIEMLESALQNLKQEHEKEVQRMQTQTQAATEENEQLRAALLKASDDQNHANACAAAEAPSHDGELEQAHQQEVAALQAQVAALGQALVEANSAEAASAAAAAAAVEVAVEQMRQDAAVAATKQAEAAAAVFAELQQRFDAVSEQLQSAQSELAAAQATSAFSSEQHVEASRLQGEVSSLRGELDRGSTMNAAALASLEASLASSEARAASLQLDLDAQTQQLRDQIETLQDRAASAEQQHERSLEKLKQSENAANETALRLRSAEESSQVLQAQLQAARAEQVLVRIEVVVAGDAASSSSRRTSSAAEASPAYNLTLADLRAAQASFSEQVADLTKSLTASRAESAHYRSALTKLQAEVTTAAGTRSRDNSDAASSSDASASAQAVATNGSSSSSSGDPVAQQLAATQQNLAQARGKLTHYVKLLRGKDATIAALQRDLQNARAGGVATLKSAAIDGGAEAAAHSNSDFKTTLNGTPSVSDEHPPSDSPAAVATVQSIPLSSALKQPAQQQQQQRPGHAHHASVPSARSMVRSVQLPQQMPQSQQQPRRKSSLLSQIADAASSAADSLVAAATPKSSSSSSSRSRTGSDAVGLSHLQKDDEEDAVEASPRSMPAPSPGSAAALYAAFATPRGGEDKSRPVLAGGPLPLVLDSAPSPRLSATTSSHAASAPPLRLNGSTIAAAPLSSPPAAAPAAAAAATISRTAAPLLRAAADGVSSLLHAAKATTASVRPTASAVSTAAGKQQQPRPRSGVDDPLQHVEWHD